TCPLRTPFPPPFPYTTLFRSPSFDPAQRILGSIGDSPIAKTTPAYSTPMLSGVSPPLIFWRLLSFRVRSGEITRHVLPPSAVLRSEEHTSELQSLRHLVCRLL